jgi:predicted kinase
MMRRAETRRGDASDATAAIVRRQLEHDPGTIGWRRIDASGPPDAVLGRAVHALRA